MPYPEPTLYAIPLFLVTLALEPLALARLRLRGRDVRGYERRDTIASLGMGIGSLFFVSLVNLGIYAIATSLVAAPPARPRPWCARMVRRRWSAGTLATTGTTASSTRTGSSGRATSTTTRAATTTSRRPFASRGRRWPDGCSIRACPRRRRAGDDHGLGGVEPRLPVLGSHRGDRPHAALVRGRLQHALPPPRAPRLESANTSTRTTADPHRLGSPVRHLRAGARARSSTGSPRTSRPSRSGGSRSTSTLSLGHDLRAARHLARAHRYSHARPGMAPARLSEPALAQQHEEDVTDRADRERVERESRERLAVFRDWNADRDGAKVGRAASGEGR